MKTGLFFFRLFLAIAAFLTVSFINNCGAQEKTEPKIFVRTTSDYLFIDVNKTENMDNPLLKVSVRNKKNDQILWEGQIAGIQNKDKIRFVTEKLVPELWSPANPVLYQLHLVLTDKGTKMIDYFCNIGFRDVETKNGKIYLNGYPIFLRGIAINPPGRGIAPEVEESREFAMEYIKFMKSIHVNIIRIPDNETWYNVCDELGMMVFGGNYSASVGNEAPPRDYDKGVAWFENEKFQPIMHHPSLIIYALTNEVPYSGVKAKEWIDFLSYAHARLKEWDNTRLYIGNAGYGYGQSGDICDLHRYWGWYYSSPYTFLNIRDYEKITFPEKVQPLTFTECVGNYTGPDGRYNLTPNHKNPVSQLNWTGHAPQREQPILADEHQSWVFKEVTELIRRLRRINPESSGVMPFTIMFRNWHTISNFVEMNPKPVTDQARISYQPVLLSWENWMPQVYAGSTINPIAHIINDSEEFSELKDNTLVIRILDNAYSVIYSDTLLLPNIRYYDIHSEKAEIILPENLFDGNYQLEGIVFSSGKEVSRNRTGLYFSGIKNTGNYSGVIPVYDSVGKTSAALKELGFRVKNIEIEDISNQMKILVVGENSVNESLVSKAKQLQQMINKGGRILMLRQDEQHQKNINAILPVPLLFPEMNIDDPEYPPPPRPSKNSFNINPERVDHPVFNGITREKLKVWSDYTGWDETKPGFPAIYPVSNGFILQNKPDKKQVAILANYSVGLEGIALAELFEGKGSVLISGFDLTNRSGIDPVADQLFINLVEYCTGRNSHDMYPLIDSPVLWGEFETEKGVLDGITSGFMLNSKPKLFGSYENLPITLEDEGHMWAGAKWGWNTRAGKQYVPYGRRVFGPYVHRDFGGVPTPLNPESKTGKAYFWCRVPEGTRSMKTLVWNPSEESLNIKIGINDITVSNDIILPGTYKWTDSKIEDKRAALKIDLEADRRLIVLETKFSK